MNRMAGPGQQQNHAAAWGKRLARRLLRLCGNDLGRVLQAWEIRVIVAARDQPGFPLPRLAVWEGEARTIRLFKEPLLEKFPDWPEAARRACAHELFHAITSNRFRLLSPAAGRPPALSRRDEEIAAEAFSDFIAKNFRLTLEGSVLNFQ